MCVSVSKRAFSLCTPTYTNKKISFRKSQRRCQKRKQNSELSQYIPYRTLFFAIERALAVHCTLHYSFF